MNFFFKKKPLVLNCVTARHEVMTYAPIQKASKFYPEWWKQLPKSTPTQEIQHEDMTMKSCIGFRDLYRQGLMLPLWSDFNIDVCEIGNSNFRCKFSDERSGAIVHNPIQRGEFAPENLYQHIKLLTPWVFQCDEEIPFMWVEPTWNDVQPYRILPAVVEFKYQFSTNINMLIPKSDKLIEVKIPFGTPMAHLVPITERPLELNVIEDHELFNKLTNEFSRISFSNTYTKMKNAKNSKCPF